jgi:hypothetical protein
MINPYYDPQQEQQQQHLLQVLALDQPQVRVTSTVCASCLPKAMPWPAGCRVRSRLLRQNRREGGKLQVEAGRQKNVGWLSGGVSPQDGMVGTKLYTYFDPPGLQVGHSSCFIVI